MSCQTPDPRVSIQMEHYQHIEIVAGVMFKGLISAQTRCTLSRCEILPNQVARRCHRLLWNYEHRLAPRIEVSMLVALVWVVNLSSVLCCSGQQLAWLLLATTTISDTILAVLRSRIYPFCRLSVKTPV